VSVPPRLLAVVHTEEEFDWSAPFSSTAVATSHARHLDRGHDLFVAHGFKPVYALSYPIARDPEAVATLTRFRDAGTAAIGAHLHPWVTPPLEEEIGPFNSFPGNLPPALERAKLACLTETIEAAFGEPPRVYLAGRYGIGANTAALLEELGYRLDLSPSPPFDYRAAGGPDFRTCGLAPRRLGGLHQVPHTGALVGPLARSALMRGLWLQTGPLGRAMRSLGGRTGLMRRLRLSPEGAGLADLRALVDDLLRRGVATFLFSFHSPSLAPGFTPYVRDDGELRRFLDTIDAFLRWFRDARGGVGIDADAAWASV
jgi:hypothetical protein